MEGNFHIKSHPGSGDLGLTPSQNAAWKMKMSSCVLGRAHQIEAVLHAEIVGGLQCITVDKQGTNHEKHALNLF